jgi:hypothetical protein
MSDISNHLPTPYEVAGHYIRTKPGASTEVLDGQMVAELDHGDSRWRSTADFIVAACNSYYGMRQDLSDARTGWEQATDAVREAETVRAQLAEALHNLEVSANTLQYCYSQRPGKFAAALTQLAADAERARAALAAAEAA